MELLVLGTLYIAHSKPQLDTASSSFHHSGTGPEHNAASASTIEISVQSAVLPHPQQGVLLQKGLQDGLQVLLLQQVLFYRSLMITKMVNCYDWYLLWKRNISLRWQ